MHKVKPMDISVIVPFKDKAKMTSQAILTFAKYGPEVKEFLLVSNNSSHDEIKLLKQLIKPVTNAKVLIYNQPFNYQKICNWGVEHSSGKFILFLNNDTELKPQSEGLIERMYEKAKHSDVGMVGCLLLYGDERTIQHAGVFLRPGLQGDHMYVGRPLKIAIMKSGSPEYPYDVRESRKMTAVTGAVQIVERTKFDAVKGFDDRFIICGGDVDLCIRLNKSGYQTWFEGGGYIVHKESQSRSYKPVPFIDFYYSYKSYIEAYDLERGDPFLPKITQGMV